MLMLVSLLTLLLVMTSTADDDLWQENSFADTQLSQLQPDLREEASLVGNTPPSVVAPGWRVKLRMLRAQ